jgi:hypothetical protein
VISLNICTSIRQHCLIGSSADGTELVKLYNMRCRSNSLWIVSEKWLIKDKSLGIRRSSSLVDSPFVCISACRERISDRNSCTSLFHLCLRASQSGLTAAISGRCWATSVSFCNCSAATSALHYCGSWDNEWQKRLRGLRQSSEEIILRLRIVNYDRIETAIRIDSA